MKQCPACSLQEQCPCCGLSAWVCIGTGAGCRGQIISVSVQEGDVSIVSLQVSDVELYLISGAEADALDRVRLLAPLQCSLLVKPAPDKRKGISAAMCMDKVSLQCAPSHLPHIKAIMAELSISGSSDIEQDDDHPHRPRHALDTEPQPQVTPVLSDASCQQPAKQPISTTSMVVCIVVHLCTLPISNCHRQCPHARR